jgi:hypothetical protein
MGPKTEQNLGDLCGNKESLTFPTDRRRVV